MADKPHIVMYIGSLNRGGAERVMVNLAEYLYGQGWKVTFVTTYVYPDEYEVPDAAWSVVGEPGELGEGGVLNPLEEQEHYRVRWDTNDEGNSSTFHVSGVQEAQGRGICRVLSGLTAEETGKNRLFNVFRRTNKLTRIFRELHPDVILSFLGKNNVMALQCGRLAGIPVVVSVRSNPAREYKDARLYRQMRRLFPKAAAVVLQTRAAVDFFPENVRRKAVVLSNSVNPAFLEPNERMWDRDCIAENEMQRVRDGVTHAGSVAATVAGAHMESNAASAVTGSDSAANVAACVAARVDSAANTTSATIRVRKTVISVGRLDENKNQQMLIRAFAQVHVVHPDWRLVLYGDGPSMEEDIALADALGIHDAVTFTGSVNNIRERIALDGIFVLTSRQEGMPNALLEAMALGLACISTDCKGGGPRDVIRDGENGILVPIDDEAALTAALQDLMDHPDKAAVLGAAAAQDMKALAPEIVNRRWEECLLAARDIHMNRRMW